MHHYRPVHWAVVLGAQITPIGQGWLGRRGNTALAVGSGLAWTSWQTGVHVGPKLDWPRGKDWLARRVTAGIDAVARLAWTSGQG